MNFKRFSTSDNQWHDTPHYIMGTDTDTITTPAVLYPSGTTATVGLKGTMSKSGTPSPTTPIQPQECGDLTGNLFDENAIGDIYPDPNASTVRTGIVISDLEINSDYYFNFDVITSTQIFYARFNGDVRLDTSSFNTREPVLIPMTDANSIRFWVGENKNWNGLKNIILSKSSTALPYEPYGYKIPILSNSTTTPVYLGEVQTTRKIKKLVLTGDETGWNKDSDIGQSARYYIAISDIENSTTNLLSSHFTQSTQYEIGTMRGYRKTVIFSVDKTQYSTTDDFKSYLATQYAAGTPVTIWYVLATEETAVVNEPIRKIGDYADIVSGITIPTTAGANTLSVDTTLQPSEVTVNYHGWHPVQSVHEAENGAWT